MREFSQHLHSGLSRSGRTGELVLDDFGTSLTGIQLLQCIEQVRCTLAQSIHPGDVVCAVLPSSIGYLVCQAAIVDIGATFIGIPADAPYLVQTVFDVGVPDWLITDGSGEYCELKSTDTGILEVDLGTLRIDRIRPSRTVRPPSAAAPVRIVVATSGSTGQGKLVSLSPSAYWNAATTIQEATAVDPTDRVLHHLPLQRGAGWFAWGSIAVGAYNLLKPLRTSDLPNALHEARITATFSVSVGLHELIDRDQDSTALPNLRTLYYSSGRVSTSMKHDLAQRFRGKLVQDYGMTEVPEPITVLTRRDHELGLHDDRILASVGSPTHRERIKTAEPASAQRPSTILVRSPHMFDGYWGSRLTNTTRWFETDDLGYFDESGYLHLTGRRSDAVRSGAVSFSLDHIRQEITKLTGVVDVVLKIIPDDRLGERLHAFVFADEHARLTETQIRNDLRRHIRDVRMIPSSITVSTHAGTTSTTTGTDQHEN